MSPEEKKPEKSELQRLVDRSTGMHSDPGRVSDESEKRRLWHFAGLGMQFAGSVGLLVYVGVRLDQHYGWGNRSTLVLGLLAVTGNLYLLIKDAIKANR